MAKPPESYENQDLPVTVAAAVTFLPALPGFLGTLVLSGLPGVSERELAVAGAILIPVR